MSESIASSPGSSKSSSIFGESNHEPCLVCAQPARGLHFQVNSCRACAAFYRRSIKATIVYRCQRGTGNCDVTQKVAGKPICRYCRMKKCKAIGMKLDNLESKFPSFKHENDQSMIFEPTTSHLPETDDDLDVKTAIEAIYLRENPVFIGIGSNMTKRLVVHLNAHFEATKPKGQVTALNDFEMVMKQVFTKAYLIRLAELTMNFDYFSQLNSKERFILFKNFCGVFFYIEIVFKSIEFFGDNLEDHRILLNDKYSVDPRKTVLFNSRTPQEHETIHKLLKPSERIDCLIIPMKKLRMTMFEFAYVAQIVLWSCFEIPDIPQSTHKLANDVIYKISNELHEYYTREMRIANYAPRQAALLRVISVSEFIFRNKQHLQIADRIFNLFDSKINYFNLI